MTAARSVKPVVDQALVTDLLQEVFAQPIQGLAPLQGGAVAQTLSFRVGDREYIIRLVTSSIDVSYEKEAFVYRSFATPDIPIPPILKVGQAGDVYYAISEKLPGRGLESLSQNEYVRTLPSIRRTLCAIHQVDVRNWRGYGWLGDDGVGMFPSWRGFLSRIIEEERPDGFYGRWHDLFRTTFLERGFFEMVYGHMMGLMRLCPEDRYLVHGGYGYNNVLAQGGEVTAVLDWVDTMYGDFVYDIAWIDFWPRGVDHTEYCRQHYAIRGFPMSQYRQRLACYKCYIGLDAMRFFAKTNDLEAYQATRRSLRNLVAVGDA